MYITGCVDLKTLDCVKAKSKMKPTTCKELLFYLLIIINIFYTISSECPQQCICDKKIKQTITDGIQSEKYYMKVKCNLLSEDVDNLQKINFGDSALDIIHL